MRTLRFALLLVFLLAASVILLRTFEHQHTDNTHPARLARLVREQPATIDVARLSETSAADLYQLGVEYLQMWRVRDAATILEHAVAADSTRQDAWLKLIECYANPLLGNERALAHATSRAEATIAAPGDTTYVFALRALYQEEDYARSIALLSQALRAKPSREIAAEMRYHLAIAYYRLGEVQAAGKELELLLKADPTVPRVVELSIKCDAAAGRWDRAARGAGELVRLYPEEPMPQVLASQVELARDRPVPALEYADHALELDPFCVPAIITRSCLYAHAGDFESARVSYEKLMLFDDTMIASAGHEGIAFAGFLAGDFDDGVEAMDEAIRHAMLAGARRRGLALSSRLVEYLCQLGRADAAEGVVERWVTEFGDVPVRLARARIQLLRGDLDAGNDVLTHLTSEKEWVLWSRALSIDAVELLALADLAQDKPHDATARLLRDEKERALPDVGAAGRRTFLAGYAAFQAGDAESAMSAFARVRQRLFGLEFPSHGDPVLYVQSLFYRGEAQLASGKNAAAKESYASFLSYWDEAAWALDAVTRAGQKVEALSGAAAPPRAN